MFLNILQFPSHGILSILLHRFHQVFVPEVLSAGVIPEARMISFSVIRLTRCLVGSLTFAPVESREPVEEDKSNIIVSAEKYVTIFYWLIFYFILKNLLFIYYL